MKKQCGVDLSKTFAETLKKTSFKTLPLSLIGKK